MYPGTHARTMPDKPALIDAETGAVVTYGELDAGSNRFAQYLYGLGLRRGGHMAFLLENNARFPELCWAALRSGLYFTAINRYVTPVEAAYVVQDCGAQVVVASRYLAETAAALGALIPSCPVRLMLDGTIPGWESYEDAIAEMPVTPLAEESLGDAMLYSSGTTGRPKGILRPLPDARPDQMFRAREGFDSYGFNPGMVYLSPAPLYHAAPLWYSLAVQSYGGTVLMMPRFDAAEALALVERHAVTHAQFVPTMFVRMLKLPEAERERHDLSSLRAVIHAAAPCPVEVKRRMIEWWGPIIHEYYGGTEGNGITRLNSAEWLAHPGSVGRAKIGIIHVCDEDGGEQPAGVAGLIYFERDTVTFGYHNDPAKTRGAQHPAHPNWSTLGDIGHVDTEGYLYLTDRQAFMIISGGVNIYPQAIEDALVTHPKVRDAAVIGLPNVDLGEEVRAVVELADDQHPSEELAEELIAYLKLRVARYMVPKAIDFTDDMPRLPTGKLYKKALRDRYATT
jgi:long-chain acyl-CoA synthetase